MFKLAARVPRAVADREELPTAGATPGLVPTE